MTRAQFIDNYMRLSGLPPSCRTASGFAIGESQRVAIPCHCEECGCPGWQMVNPDDYALPPEA